MPVSADPTVLVTTYFALLHIVAPHLVADERNGDTSSFAAGDMFTKVLMTF
jgi:hypothetical protein